MAGTTKIGTVITKLQDGIEALTPSFSPEVKFKFLVQNIELEKIPNQAALRCLFWDIPSIKETEGTHWTTGAREKKYDVNFGLLRRRESDNEVMLDNLHKDIDQITNFFGKQKNWTTFGDGINLVACDKVAISSNTNYVWAVFEMRIVINVALN